MNVLEKIFGKKESNLDNDISRTQEDVLRIQDLITVEKNRYPDEENNTELQRLQKQLGGAKDRLSLLKEKQRREGEKFGELTQ